MRKKLVLLFFVLVIAAFGSWSPAPAQIEPPCPQECISTDCCRWCFPQGAGCVCQGPFVCY